MLGSGEMETEREVGWIKVGILGWPGLEVWWFWGDVG